MKSTWQPFVWQEIALVSLHLCLLYLISPFVGCSIANFVQINYFLYGFVKTFCGEDHTPM